MSTIVVKLYASGFRMSVRVRRYESSPGFRMNVDQMHSPGFRKNVLHENQTNQDKFQKAETKLRDNVLNWNCMRH